MLQEQRVEYERIQSELARLGPELAGALQERDTEARNARVALDRAAAASRENGVLERQLQDLGRQLRHILRQIAIRDDPSFATAEDPDVDGDYEILDATDTDRIISDNLTLFKNISQLQEQNQRLLRITREMAAQMEANEKESRETAEMAETDAVRRAKSVIEDLHAKIKGQEVAEKALRKEVDMLASLLTKSKHGGAGGASVNSTAAFGVASGAISVDNDRLAEMSSVLREMGVNSARLQEDLSASQKQIGHLNVSLAKANAQIDFLTGKSASR